MRGIYYIWMVLILCWKNVHSSMFDCYSSTGSAQRCLPPFVNAAYSKTIVASNTCGSPAEEYCVQTGVTGVSRSCHICDSRDPNRNHGTEYLTDLNEDETPTWWQTQTMVNDVQYPNMVNLTLNLDKAYDITYVRVRFHTSRPESFAIYKKKCEDCEWQPYQYYSGSCFATYHIDNKEIVTVDDEQKALCTDDFSDISPLTGGNVAFSTLESRPSAYNFDRSTVLQDWVKATGILITLNRINTFGDEVFQDPKILRSYYYGISDISVGGRCSCNGHASKCYVGSDNRLQCRCEHNTAGRDCERCAPFYNDRLWARGTRDDPGECRACECNGKSNTCYFDANLYQQTGRGGHCTECRDNTDGPHCERCQIYHYRDGADACRPCHCSAIGAVRQQCDNQGRCTCKPGVGGPRCDQCLEGYYGLSEGGCRSCNCNPAGTAEGSVCDSDTGSCVCKLNVEGPQCNRCASATMNLQESNPYGCTACFCFGHSSVCMVASGYTVAHITSSFDQDVEGWRGQDRDGQPVPVQHRNGRISMEPRIDYLRYWVAPAKFLGVQRFSYNQFLEFELFVENIDTGSDSEDQNSVAFPNRDDIVLEGSGYKVTASITSQGNLVPNEDLQLYRFRLHEQAGFFPILTPFQFQKMLNDLQSIRIRSTYGEGLRGHLDNVQLTTAERSGNGPTADWVEECFADGFDGLFTDKCAPGYTRDPPNGGVYAPCVPCMCNGHADVCDKETGVCDCQHNTMGEHCELCEDGFYFSGDESRRGTPQECQPCPCPEQSSCVLINDGGVVCTNCPPGHAGRTCEICMDGWFGDPLGRGPCLRCMCNGNIDENAIMNCDRVTGECLKCIYNTTGSHCERCLDGYFGSPFSKNPEEQCRLCECNLLGSSSATCNPRNGACSCLPNVHGRQCDRCAFGFWDFESGQGCRSCNCDFIGASTGACDQDSGQCICQPGVEGQRCDRCQPNYYGLTRAGCTACDCHPDGSVSLQCMDNGRCICKDGVFGVKCDHCQENYYDLASGCIACPTCYGLVQDAVNEHRSELDELEDMIDRAEEIPIDNQSNAEFREALTELNNTANNLLERGLENKNKWDSINEQYNEAVDNVNALLDRVTVIQVKFDECEKTLQRAVELNLISQRDVEVIRTTFDELKTKLTQAMMDLNSAQEIADESLNKENNMTKLAQEAQAIAADHVTQSNAIVATAQEAFETSKRAKDAIEESIETLEGLINALEDLINSENKIPAARQLREELLGQSGQVKNDTKAAKMESTDLFTQASKLTVPDVDTDSMDLRSLDVITQSQNLLPEIDRLDQEYKDSYGELQTEADKARVLLDVANAAQNTADMLLAQAYSALNEAEKAVERGNNSYYEILDILASLESIDDEISDSRDEAIKALESVPEIQEKIDRANNLTQDAKSLLGEAKSIAQQASTKAQQAQSIAEFVQEQASDVRVQADESHGRATNISIGVEELDGSLGGVENRLSNAEAAAEKDRADVELASLAASEARQAATDSKRKVDSVLEQLQELLNRLRDSPGVSGGQIKRLEQMFESIEADVEELNMDDVISQLKDHVELQEINLRFYDSQIAVLRKDIANLEDISAAVPQTCSRNEEVEQP